MNNKLDAKSLYKMLEARAARDDVLIKSLNELDRLILDDTEIVGPSRGSSRARLPYSSDPPPFEAVWN